MRAPGHISPSGLGKCSRCGLIRQTRGNRGDLCRDCRYVAGLTFEVEDDVAWHRVGLTWKPVSKCPCGRVLDRLGADCHECRTWAERDAVRTSWRRPIDSEREVA